MLKFIRRKWLPQTLVLLAPWFANFALKFAQFDDALGLTEHKATVDRKNAMVQWLAAAQTASEANSSGFRQFRDETLYAGKGDTAPAAPVTTLPAPPAELETAIIEWLVDLVEKKIQTADAYTDEIGVQLGIVVPPGEGISPDSVKPSVECFPAQSGYEFAAVATGRGEATMAEVEIRFAGSETWQTVKSFTGKSANVKITPTTPGQPLRIQVRIQLYKNNEKYGQPSDAVYVTLNP
jgi:hypothetical protein